MSNACVCVFVKGNDVMEEQDLREIGITDPGHRRKILSAARSLPKVCEQQQDALHRVSNSISTQTQSNEQ